MCDKEEREKEFFKHDKVKNKLKYNASRYFVSEHIKNRTIVKLNTHMYKVI